MNAHLKRVGSGVGLCEGAHEHRVKTQVVVFGLVFDGRTLADFQLCTPCAARIDDAGNDHRRLFFESAFTLGSSILFKVERLGTVSKDVLERLGAFRGTADDMRVVSDVLFASGFVEEAESVRKTLDGAR